MGWGGRLFEAGRLLTFSAFGMGAYSRWALIRGWALIRIITVNCQSHFEKAKQKLCLISGNLKKLKIDYCNRVFTGTALLYHVLTEVMQVLP